MGGNEAVVLESPELGPYLAGISEGAENPAHGCLQWRVMISQCI
jgi:hypothetical protein